MGKRENFEKFLKAREKISSVQKSTAPQSQPKKTSASRAGVESFERLVPETNSFVKMGNSDMRSQVVSAGQQLTQLDQIEIENASALIKYRQNITVPAVWLGKQEIRVSNIPMIPAEKISNINTYIQSRLIRVDGGNLDNR